MKTFKQLLAWASKDLPGLLRWVIQLQEQLQALKDLLAQNSHNSSRPPASDRVPSAKDKPKPKSLRRRGRRKSGGQPGHPGRTLRRVEHPEHLIPHQLDRCACGRDLRRQPHLGHERRQVFDLPELKLQVTEHQAQIKHCPGCARTSTAPFPEHVSAPVQYGVNFLSLLSYFYDAQHIPLRRIRTLCTEIFSCPVSEGTIQSARQQQFESLQAFEQRLEDSLPQEALLHADETGLRVERTNYWVHVLCTPLLTFLSVHFNRGKKAMDAIGLIGKFEGWLMHDFLSAYLQYDCLHTFCKPHLLRELIFLFEQHQQAWAKALHDLLLKMRDAVEKRKARDAPFSEKELQRWHERYWKILQSGRRANPHSKRSNRKGRPKQSKAQNLLDRMENYDQCILAFLADFSLPFSNNQAERDQRMVKVHQKISGCFRTLHGARQFARSFSYISTLRKHGLPVWENLRNALLGRPFLPQTPNRPE